MTNTAQNWKQVKIQDITDNLDNKRVPITKSDRNTGDIPYYGATGVVDYVSDYIFDEQLLLVGEDGADWSAYANSAYIIDGKSWVNNHAHVLRVTGADIVFLKEYLNFSDLRLHVTGTTRGKLNKSDLMDIQIPLPSTQTQQKIASILRTLDNEITKTDQIIQKTEELKKGLMNDFLTRGINHKEFKNSVIGKVPKNWEVVAVGEICDCIVPGRNKPKIFDGDIPWITTPNIRNSSINFDGSILYVSKDELKKSGNKIIPKNSVIMSCVGNFGIVAVTDREITINQQLHAFLPSNNLDSTFLKYALISQKSYMENLATKSSVPYLNKTNCNSVPVPKPPIDEQRKIGEIISSVDSQIVVNLLRKEILMSLKNGVMSDIFTRKVDVN